MRRIFALALAAVGLALLGYTGYVRVESWNFQRRGMRELERPAERERPTEPARSAPPARPLVERIDIHRLGISAIVAEGSDEATLRHAVGHIAGTAIPGEPGNVGLAGHRDTFFRPLRNIHRGDVIQVTTTAGEFQYRVASTKVVDPHAIDVLKSGSDEQLTLVTCYPFYFIGSAPKRFIVRAERDRSLE